MRSFLWCYYSWFITSLALEKCKKEFIILEIILVQDFCPLKIKITQFPDGFRLNYLKQWRHSLLKKDRERFRGLPTDVKFTINCAKLMFIFVIHRLAIQILPRIYFSCGGAAGISPLKKLIRMFGPSSSVVLELRRIISNQKWANASLVLRYIGLGWFIIMDIFCESSSILQSSRQRHLNI